MNSPRSKFIHLKDKGKARVNWWREGRMGISILTEDEKILEHDIITEDDDRITFKYGEFEPDEVRSDIRDKSFEELKNSLGEFRKKRVHSNSSSTSSSTSQKSSQKTGSTSQKSTQKTDDDKIESKEDLMNELDNLSAKEKAAMKELLSEEGD